MPILHDDPRQAVKYNRQRGREVQRHRRPTPPASRPAPARRPTAVQRALAQERQYASQGRAIAHQAHVQRVTRHKTEARQRRIERAAEKRNPTVFGRNALKTRQRSQREAIQALADYHAANPQEYDRKIREANKSRFRRNLDKVSGSAEHLIHKGTNAARDVLDKSQGGNQRRLQSAGLAPDPTKLADEALDIVANTPTSAYIAGAAGVEAVKGHPRRAGKLWKDFKETSALAPTATAVAKNVRGKGAKKDWKEAGKRAQERPLTTALELMGTKAILGRGAGAAARSGALGGAAKRGAALERPNLKLYDPEKEGVGPAQGRAYSRDVINKTVQVAHERRVAKGARARKHGKNRGTQRRPGRDPHLDLGARLVPAQTLAPGRATPPIRQRLKKQVDSDVFGHNRAVEHRVGQAARYAAKQVKKGDYGQLAQMARADKIREALRHKRVETTGEARKQIRQLLALDDNTLLQEVKRQAAPRRTRKREQKITGVGKANYDVVARSLGRRAAKGKYLTPAQQKAVYEAQVKRAVVERNAPAKFPGTAAAQAALAGVERRAVPRVGTSRQAPLDLKGYLKMVKRRRTTGGKKKLAPEFNRELANTKVIPQEIPGRIAHRVRRISDEQNQMLIADKYGVGGHFKSKDAARRGIRNHEKQVGKSGLVPLKRGENDWTLAPKVIVDRFAQHQSVDTGPFRSGGPLDRATNVFKDVVLTTSSPARWIGGNVADIGMRGAFEGITPFDIARGVKINKQLRKQGLRGEQASAKLTGGGLYTAGEALSPHVGKISRANVPRKAFRVWKQFVYGLEHHIEVAPQLGRVGKTFRKDAAQRRVRGHDAAQQNSLRTLLKMSDQQMENFAKGIARDHALEARVQHQVEDVIGRWGKVSPAMRRSLSLAPFAQWLGAATRYTLLTLPAHHPIKTSLLAGVSQMTEKERKALGLSYFASDENRAPDYQMGLLPTKIGKNKYGTTVGGYRTSRMTSLGTAAEMPWGIPQFILPQVSGAFSALQGQSFTGEPLVYPESAPADKRGLPISKSNRLPIAAGAQLETLVPFASAFRRSILERGLPAEPSSTILTPQVRMKRNKQTRQWETPQAGPWAGLGEWALPFSPYGRMYTQGAGRDIERSQITESQNKAANARRKRENLLKKGDLLRSDDRKDLFAPDPAEVRSRTHKPVDLFAP